MRADRAPAIAAVERACQQTTENLTCLGEPLTAADVAFIAEVGQQAKKVLDTASEVFLNEVTAAGEAH